MTSRPAERYIESRKRAGDPTNNPLRPFQAYNRGMTRIRYLPLILLMACIVLTGCPASTPSTSTPAAPTPPQITVANSVNALAQAVDGAVTAAIAARDAGKVDQADVTAIESFAAVIATTGKQVDAELRSADDWATQRTKILVMVSNASLGTLKAHISPGAQVLVSSLVALVNQILTAVGGPTI